RANDDIFGPQAGDLLLRFDANAFANGQQPNHARNAHKNAQNGEQRPQRVQEQALDTKNPRAEESTHHRSRSSDWIRPSRKRITRLARAATSSSCVTIMMVLPRLLRSARSCKILSVVTESRLPVGSSASMK